MVDGVGWERRGLSSVEIRVGGDGLLGGDSGEVQGLTLSSVGSGSGSGWASDSCIYDAQVLFARASRVSSHLLSFVSLESFSPSFSVTGFVCQYTHYTRKGPHTSFLFE